MHHAALYFAATTLQMMPELFQPMQRVVLQALDVIADNIGMNQAGICKTKSKLLFGYCAIFKLGRKLGLTSIHQVVSVLHRLFLNT